MKKSFDLLSTSTQLGIFLRATYVVPDIAPAYLAVNVFSSSWCPGVETEYRRTAWKRGNQTSNDYDPEPTFARSVDVGDDNSQSENYLGYFKHCLNPTAPL